jgi:hypothetical protein
MFRVRFLDLLELQSLGGQLLQKIRRLVPHIQLYIKITASGH